MHISKYMCMQIKHPVGYYYFVESSLLVTGHLLLSGKLSLQMILTPKQVLSARKCYSALPTQFLLTVAPSMLSSAPSLPPQERRRVSTSFAFVGFDFTWLVCMWLSLD